MEQGQREEDNIYIWTQRKSKGRAIIQWHKNKGAQHSNKSEMWFAIELL